MTTLAEDMAALRLAWREFLLAVGKAWGLVK